MSCLCVCHRNNSAQVGQKKSSLKSVSQIRVDENITHLFDLQWVRP